MRRKTRFDPRAYPRTVRELVRDDYSKRLGKREQEWLAAFNEAHYGASPDHLRFIIGKACPAEERRRLWREIQRYKRDTSSQPTRIAVDPLLKAFEQFIESEEDHIIDQLDEHKEAQMAKEKQKTEAPKPTAPDRRVISKTNYYQIVQYGQYSFQVFRINPSNGTPTKVESDNTEGVAIDTVAESMLQEMRSQR